MIGRPEWVDELHARIEELENANAELEAANAILRTAPVTVPADRTEAVRVAGLIRAFDQECQEGEFTDTDRAWQLLRLAEQALGGRRADL